MTKIKVKILDLLTTLFGKAKYGTWFFTFMNKFCSRVRETFNICEQCWAAEIAAKVDGQDLCADCTTIWWEENSFTCPNCGKEKVLIDENAVANEADDEYYCSVDCSYEADIEADCIKQHNAALSQSRRFI